MSVSLRTLGGIIDEFFFIPESVLPLVIFRIAFGLIGTLNAYCFLVNYRLHFSPAGLLPDAYFQKKLRPYYWSLFAAGADSHAWSLLILVTHFLSAIGVLIGFWTTTASVVFAVTLLSIHNRNPLILSGGDVLNRLLAFLLCFTSSGSALSADAWIAGAPFPETWPTAEPWALRLMQIQMTIVYVQTVHWKLTGKTWRNGTACHFPLQLERYARFSMPPFFDRSPWLHIATWGTLVVELAVGTGVWVTEFRIPMLIAGIAMHLFFECCLRLGMFSWVMICGLLLFWPVT